MKREPGADFRIIEIAQLAQGQAMTMRHLGDEFLLRSGRDGAFNYPSCRIHVIHDVEGRSLVAQVAEHFHQPEDILGIVEIPGSDILDLNDNGRQVPDGLQVESDMVGPRGQLGIPGRKDNLQVAALLEKLVHIAVMDRIPAVLGAETADLAAEQSLIQLVFQGCGSE